MCVYMHECTYTFIHTHTHTQKNTTQPLKKNGVLPFAKTWLDLEVIMLSEISQRNTNTICYNVYI